MPSLGGLGTLPSISRAWLAAWCRTVPSSLATARKVGLTLASSGTAQSGMRRVGTRSACSPNPARSLAATSCSQWKPTQVGATGDGGGRRDVAVAG